MGNEISSGATAAIIAVVVIVLGIVAYNMWVKEPAAGQSPPPGAVEQHMKEMKEKAMQGRPASPVK